MFNQTCLYEKPLIQIREKFEGDIPEHFLEIHSSQFWYHMDSDFIDKIVAMRVYPYQDYVVLKIRPCGSTEFVSVILKDPELRILKRIWDCNNLEFNRAIKSYIHDSLAAFQQWMLRTGHSKDCLQWFSDITR